jgi:hypothetical protein
LGGLGFHPAALHDLHRHQHKSTSAARVR